MQISPRVHALRIPFVLEPVPGRKLERSVHAYLLQAGEVTLIDSGVAGAGAAIFHCLENLGGSPGEITRLLLTHAHPDHLGGAPGVAASAGCMVAAHPLDVPWIEDTERQFRERPVPGFHDLVEGPVKVSQLLKDNDVLELGDDEHTCAPCTPLGTRGGTWPSSWRRRACSSAATACPNRGPSPFTRTSWNSRAPSAGSRPCRE